MRTQTVLVLLGLLTTTAAPAAALLATADPGDVTERVAEAVRGAVGDEWPERPSVGEATRPTYEAARDALGLSDCSNGFLVHFVASPTSVCADGDTTEVRDLLPESPR